jgi:hypothetical protein
MLVGLYRRRQTSVGESLRGVTFKEDPLKQAYIQWRKAEKRLISGLALSNKNKCQEVSVIFRCLIIISNLSYDRSTASSKTIPPLNAI